MYKREKYIKVTMPYIPEVSVNSAYNRGDPKLGHKPELSTWAILLRGEINKKLNHKKIVKEHGVQLDIKLLVKKRPGRRPDVSNFRKVPQDIIADCLGVDDSIFHGSDWALEEGDDEIEFHILWTYVDECREKDISTTALYNGPLTASIRYRMGLYDGQYCIGFGTPYCLKCDAVIECPAEFYPGVYTDIPCRLCSVICACKNMDTNYEHRERRINEWWRRRKSGQT